MLEIKGTRGRIKEKFKEWDRESKETKREEREEREEREAYVL